MIHEAGYAADQAAAAEMLDLTVSSARPLSSIRSGQLRRRGGRAAQHNSDGGGPRVYTSASVTISEVVHTPRLPQLRGAATIPPMCVRYASFLPAEATARIFGMVNPLPNLAPPRNVAPTDDCAVRRHQGTGQRPSSCQRMTRGLLPF
jgi:hypothetical protein